MILISQRFFAHRMNKIRNFVYTFKIFRFRNINRVCTQKSRDEKNR